MLKRTLPLSPSPCDTQEVQPYLKTVTEHPYNAEALPPSLDHPVTPTDLFYVRNNFDVPSVAAETWQLRVGGLVRKEVTLHLEQLKALPRRTIIATLECAGNGRIYYEPLPEGTPWDCGAVSTGTWTGVELREVLRMADPMAEGTEVLFMGLDRGERSGAEIPFARSLPLNKAVDGDTLLVYEMNGQPLPPEHGYPVRLLVPGWYAVASVKWLAQIEVTDQPFTGHFQTEKYMMRYSAADPGVPVREMVVKSLIVSPLAGARVLRNVPCRITGKAWSGAAPIRCVEISTDGGCTWHPAGLGDDLSPYAWQTWTYNWIPATTGAHHLCVRATDARGNAQPQVPVWNVDGYQYNGIRSIEVIVD